jgi:hypothetical protein
VNLSGSSPGYGDKSARIGREAAFHGEWARLVFPQPVGPFFAQVEPAAAHSLYCSYRPRASGARRRRCAGETEIRLTFVLEGANRMAAAITTPCTTQIGETAGLVWHALEKNGPLSYTKLVKLLSVPRDTVMQAVGWLAREGKVDIEESSRGRIVMLR